MAKRGSNLSKAKNTYQIKVCGHWFELGDTARIMLVKQLEEQEESGEEEEEEASSYPSHTAWLERSRERERERTDTEATTCYTQYATAVRPHTAAPSRSERVPQSPQCACVPLSQLSLT